MSSFYTALKHNSERFVLLKICARKLLRKSQSMLAVESIPIFLILILFDDRKEFVSYSGFSHIPLFALNRNSYKVSLKKEKKLFP